jgi:hypothetical protein
MFLFNLHRRNRLDGAGVRGQNTASRADLKQNRSFCRLRPQTILIPPYVPKGHKVCPFLHSPRHNNDPAPSSLNPVCGGSPFRLRSPYSKKWGLFFERGVLIGFRTLRECALSPLGTDPHSRDSSNVDPTSE